MINSSFTDFPLIKSPPETDFFFKEDPGHNTGDSCEHAHIIASMSLTILVRDFQPRM